KKAVNREAFLAELTEGAFVVHIDHGIARFAGLVRMPMDGHEREYLELHYAEGDKLFVPSDQLSRVSRYVGPSDREPRVTRLDSGEWQRAKSRVRRAVQLLARELLTLYAAREIVSGHAYPADTPWQMELEASFPYVETPDQIAAITAVKRDMESPRPMDRLVCGDVGYGKTEVAIRAAFKAVMDGRQVAVLVPTTVLAQQHFQTFGERLAAFPARLEMLSRFKTDAEQRQIVEGLSAGTVDIVIGTHRLLQKDVGFQDLGLVVIDEEQRFGVAHKEHLKRLRREVDVLTLSATPIPRTLYMAMGSIRDMSTMETPPEERLPIKTYVSEFDERLVRETVLRELERGGQVYFVHNRVHNIDMIAQKVRENVPEATVSIGHGRMDEKELARTMEEFVQGETDVLVCTT
ncbi:MAG: DEAD/DEAH box helicase, partial [bacterium]